ncbi:MAG TPA: hypothetical protein VEV81_11410, partial [Pyrinomonadaceae bacterium]|nr:hypothetical protein [Pyrinomonadaceae bacterium]
MKNRVALLSLVILTSASTFAQSIQQRTIVAANTAFAAAPAPQPARLASIRTLSDTEGSRVVVTSDVTLDGYR